MKEIHLNSLNVNPPRISGLVKADLHVMSNGFPLGKDVPKCLRTQDVPVILGNIYTMWECIWANLMSVRLISQIEIANIINI